MLRLLHIAIGTGGVVYHVDGALANRNSKPEWNNQNAHYYIRVEQADGLDKLECGSGQGDAGDAYGKGGCSVYGAE